RLVPLPEAVACYCLSERVAEPVRPIAAGPVRVAGRPDQGALFALLGGGGDAGGNAAQPAG
ncbi:hypothetical protein, partial [Propylenella binzhouense]|uniref:hypothetical protein n=1 Tax=Propylenella binzhouense TaxID=2555902 RepID=UPI00136F5747